MKKKIISCICFWLLFFLIFTRISYVLVPTWSDKAGMPIKRTNDFYAQEEDTMDAMIFGSSYSYYSVSPLPIWNNYGITSYSFGNPSQRIWTTYYYMEEAFKYQSPKVVFYEMGTAHVTEPAGDGQNRQNLDPLEFSATKLKAILEVTGRTNETLASYLMPGLRYHSRWNELSEEDFTKGADVGYYGRGSLMRFGAKPAKSKDRELWMTDTGEDLVFPEENEEYIDKMIELCEKNGAELVFVRFPEIYWTKNLHDMVQSLADKKGITYIDYNTFPEEYGLDWDTDTSDRGSHMNVMGNEKVSNYLGQYMKDHYGFEDKRENPDYASWVENAEKFQKVYEKNEIANILDLNQYLKKIQEECYTAVIAVRRDATKGLHDDAKETLKSMGISENLINQPDGGYIGIIDGGQIIDQMDGYELLNWNKKVGNIKIDATSGGLLYGDTAVVLIDGESYAADSVGMNIVVYDKDLKRVVDSVSFNTSNRRNKISRKLQNNAGDEF